VCSGIRRRGSNEESSEEGMHYRQPHHHNNRGIPKAKSFGYTANTSSAKNTMFLYAPIFYF
jgi:hypothetical protein